MMKIYRLVRGFARQMSRANVNAYAASTAFFIFLSLIPMIMLICSVLAATPLVQKSDLLTAATIFPASITPLIVGLIDSIYDSTFGMISMTAIVTIWSAGKGILALMRGLNAMNGVVEDRNYVLQRLIASFYLIVFLAMVVFSLVVMVFGNLLASVIVRHVPGMENLFAFLLHFRGIFSWCMMTLLFALMYTFIPNCKLRFAWQLPGAAFSAVTWNVFSWGFSIYVRHSGGFDMYGSLTTIVILMLWLYFCFYLFLIGAHINRFLTPFRKVREKQRQSRRGKGASRRRG